MAQRIPLYFSSSADFTQRLELEGAELIIRLYWNVRNKTAYMDFTDRNKSTIHGMKIVPNFPLLRQIKGTVDFRGDFVVLPATLQAPAEITYENFGTDHILYYLTNEEMENWENTYGSR